jgi:glycine/D-amino acid oxidase-like deaminating enzyme
MLAVLGWLEIAISIMTSETGVSIKGNADMAMGRSEQGSWDVIVVGGGIFGLSCAYACSKRGLRVAVFEAGRVAGQASGGIVGALAPHVPEQWNAIKQFQFESLAAADAYWADVDARSGQSSGYGRIGRLIPVMDERLRDLAKFRINSAQELWQGKFSWSYLPEGHRLIAPAAAPFGVVYETLSARISPAKACASLAKALTAMGVDLFEHREVVEIEQGRVSGSWGTAKAQDIILASGVDGFSKIEKWTGKLGGTGIKGQAALLDLDMGDAPQIFADGIYVVPHDNGTVAVGSTSENTFESPISTDVKLDDILQRARNICPTLVNAPVVQRWAGLRPKARRRDPMLGAIAGQANVWAALGAFKIGFGIAPKVGEVLADMVTGTDVALPNSFTVGYHFDKP